MGTGIALLAARTIMLFEDCSRSQSDRLIHRLDLEGIVVRKPNRSKRQLRIENLEDRRLLASDLSLGSLEIDPSQYDDSSILVRWKKDAHCTLAVCSTDFDSRLPGISSSMMSNLPSLREIALPHGLHIEDALKIYQDHPLVEYAEPNFKVKATATVPNDPRFTDMWQLENTLSNEGTLDADIDVTDAWDVTTGNSATLVAVLDTGVDYNHVDIAANIWTNTGEVAGDGIDNDGNGYIDDVHGYDFHNNDGDPMDDQGHGTHVAGTIGAVSNNGVGISGINWDIQIMALKFLGSDGSGTSEAAIEAINYAVANGAVLSNNSWGGDPYSQAMFDAISAARNAGHIFVAAAGNGDIFGIGINNDESPFYPSGYNLDNVVSVAATDSNDNVATFSNYGATTVDLGAPGVNILSLGIGGGYTTSSGTSMAAPHVAGVLSLVRGQNPGWTHQQVIDQVLNTVDPIPSLQGVTSTGGRLNAAAAVGNPVDPPPPPPPVPLPIVEDLEDGLAQDLAPQTGAWTVSAGRLDVRPSVQDPNLAAINTFRLIEPLPQDVEIQARVNTDQGRIEFFGIVLQDYLTNGFIVFDYQSVTDFKFAGLDVDLNRWVIGHRDASAWYMDAYSTESLNWGVDYDIQVSISNGNTVQMTSSTGASIQHTFAESIVDGKLGIGSRNGSTHFDNILARANGSVTPTSLPYGEDFADGDAENLQDVLGVAGVDSGRLHLKPFTHADAVTTVSLSQAIPDNFRFQVDLNAQAAEPLRLENGFVIFDYQSPTDFKFAGAHVGVDQWVIGHRSVEGWMTDAWVPFQLDADQDYTMEVLVTSGNKVAIAHGGIIRVDHVFGDSVIDGDVGVGSKNALTSFDNLVLESYTPPSPPPGAALPYSEDFSDGIADDFVSTSGWSVSNGRYSITPPAGTDGIARLVTSQSLPVNLDIEVTLNGDPGSADYLSNAFVIFDYQSPTDFKFAGTYIGIDQWVIGHRTASSWVTDAWVAGVLDPNVDYDVKVSIEAANKVTLFANGLAQVSHTFADAVVDGQVGLGTKNARSHFDNLSVVKVVPADPAPAADLPMVEDFEDGEADYLEPQSGVWSVAGGDYDVTPVVGQDAISTVSLAEPLPSDVNIHSDLQGPAGNGTFLSNAFVIFDYQSATDFKFAGAYIGIDQWVIGHRTASSWVTDVWVTAPLDANTLYDVQISIQDSDKVALIVDGNLKLMHEFGDSVVDGDVGVGTKNAIAHFDNLTVQTPPEASATTLPFVENFDDQIANHLNVVDGVWAVSSGRWSATPFVNHDAVALLENGLPNPDDIAISTLMNGAGAANGYLSNAFIIFDYQSPTDFNFAGAYFGVDQWVIGHRTASDWVTDVWVTDDLSADTDYNVRVAIEDGKRVTLYSNGIAKASFDYTDAQNEGQIGVGTKNALSEFDNLVIAEQAATSLPVDENFDDGIADYFEPRAGTWTTASGAYYVTPTYVGNDTISTLTTGQTLPPSIDIEATLQAYPGTAEYLSNAFVIFDYHGPSDFKFAGAYAGINQWVMGHRTANDWVTDVWTSATINANTDYDVRVSIEYDSHVVLEVDGQEVLRHIYDEPVANGRAGLGTKNGQGRFDNFNVTATTPASALSLPGSENFENQQAETLSTVSGTWNVSQGRLEGTPVVGNDAISLMRIDQALPTDIGIEATIQGAPGGGGFLSNGFLIFDYHSPTDFRFAGAYFGVNQWVIGHRTESDWVTDVWTGVPLSANTDYQLRLVVEGDSTAKLYANSNLALSFDANDDLTNGDIGFGTKNAIARYDNFEVESLVGPQALAKQRSERGRMQAPAELWAKAVDEALK